LNSEVKGGLDENFRFQISDFRKRVQGSGFRVQEFFEGFAARF
jgi:hypothetical protein